MRSRVSPARALFRIISAQASSTSSNATATASASSSSGVNATSRSARTIPSTRRRRSISSTSSPSAAASLASQSISKSTTSSSPSSSHITIQSKNAKTGKGHQTIFINANLPSKDKSSDQDLVSGLHPVHPPKTSLAGVATQAFFALDRPLLEHVFTSSPSSSISHGSASQISDEQDEKTATWIKTVIENAHEAIMETASQASRLSQEELSRTTFVIGGALGSANEPVNAQKVTSLSFDRFVKLVDTLAESKSGVGAVYKEAKALEEEATLEQDIEKAVSEALEQGEDASAAKKLGSECDLVVLGEPDGPNPEWPRGVATFLTEETRALEPPELKSEVEEKQAEDLTLEQSMKLLNVEELAKAFAGEESAYTVRKVTEKDPQLLLSHALVQAILPPRLKWDRIQAKMDAAAAGVTSSGESNLPIDVTTLNADPLPAVEASTVELDSVKRKRRKKMNKHKYKKFRKATRTERNRLKK